MNENEVYETLASVDAIMQGHFVYASGRHGPGYINKDAVYPHIDKISALCREIAERHKYDQIDVVVGPELGGIIIAILVAYHLRDMSPRMVMPVPAEKERVSIPDPEGMGRNCFVETGRFVFKRGYDKLLPGRRCLFVEDILNTGGSASEGLDAVQRAGGRIVSAAALVNRGGVTAEMLGVPKLEALFHINMETFAEDDCPQCGSNVPVNLDVGKGAAFLAKQT